MKMVLILDAFLKRIFGTYYRTNEEDKKYWFEVIKKIQQGNIKREYESLKPFISKDFKKR